MTPQDVGALILILIGFACGLACGKFWGRTAESNRHMAWLNRFQRDMKKITDPK